MILQTKLIIATGVLFLASSASFIPNAAAPYEPLPGHMRVENGYTLTAAGCEGEASVAYKMLPVQQEFGVGLVRNPETCAIEVYLDDDPTAEFTRVGVVAVTALHTPDYWWADGLMYEQLRAQYNYLISPCPHSIQLDWGVSPPGWDGIATELEWFDPSPCDDTWESYRWDTVLHIGDYVYSILEAGEEGTVYCYTSSYQNLGQDACLFEGAIDIETSTDPGPFEIEQPEYIDTIAPNSAQIFVVT